jgi:hypothetical protein
MKIKGEERRALLLFLHLIKSEERKASHQPSPKGRRKIRIEMKNPPEVKNEE